MILSGLHGSSHRGQPISSTCLGLEFHVNVGVYTTQQASKRFNTMLFVELKLIGSLHDAIQKRLEGLGFGLKCTWGRDFTAYFLRDLAVWVASLVGVCG